MAGITGDVSDDSYVVNINAVPPTSLSGPASPDFSSSVPNVNPGPYISHTFPISTNSQEIRLLDLQRSDHTSDPLVGTFRTVSLDQESTPCYTALSYVWGALQPTQGTTIDLGVGHLSITKTCHDALRQIRSLHGNTTIWVDSICIDQTSEAERHHQVSLMGDVYSRADKVYIWLGEETPDIRRALEYIEFAASFMFLPLDHGETGGVYGRLKFLFKVLPPVVTVKLMRNKWKLSELRHSYRLADLEELLGVAWFSRIWTFQEVVLASDAVMLCGTANLKWSVFVRGFRCLDFLFTNREGFWDSIDRVHKEKIFLCEKSSGETIGCQEDFWEGDFKAPRGFLALQRMFFLWMRVDRRGQRRNTCPSDDAPGHRSILWNQRPYIDMWSRHLRNLGMFSTHIAAYLLACCAIFAIVGFSQVRKHAVETLPSMYVVAIGSLLGSLGVLVALQLVSYNPEGYSRDLNIQEAENEIKDQLMSSVIENLGYRQAKDPKDMSYGLYGILRGFGVDLAALDYSKPQAHVFHELCLDMLKFRPSAINLLMYANKGQHEHLSMDTQTEMSPTWVPDWSRLKAKQFKYLEPSSIPEFYWATEKGLTSVTRFSGDQKAIFVSGHWKGDVVFCMESLQMTLDEVSRSFTDGVAFTSIKIFSGWVEALRKLVFTKYRAIRRGPTCEGACCNQDDKRDCYCPSRDEDEHPATAIYTFLIRRKSRIKATDRDLLRFRKVYDMFAQEDQDEKSRPAEMTLQAAQDIWASLHKEDLLEFFVEIMNNQAKSDCRWFITSDGYLGCGSESVMPGDRLALVAGVAVPMVLRPLDFDKPNWFDSRYTAVCSAYVLGWMYGERFQKEQVSTIHII